MVNEVPLVAVASVSDTSQSATGLPLSRQRSNAWATGHFPCDGVREYTSFSSGSFPPDMSVN